MKIKYYLKFFSVVTLSLVMAIGCTSTSEETSGGGTPSSEQAAKDAIAAAKAANDKAKAEGYEWRDTGKMIKAAEKALADGDFDGAIKKANKARHQAENAVEQKYAELERLRALGIIGDDVPPPPVEAKEGQYQVVRGDNLWNISGKPNIYNNPYQWPLIYKANSTKIKDADLIYPGQVFDISSASSAEVDAAIRHAKTRGAWSLGAVEASDKAYLSN